MKRNKKIPVVVVTDNHYLPMLAALVKSIEANLNKETNLDLWIVDDNVSIKSKTKFETSINPEITLHHWVAAHDIIPAGIELPLDKSTYPLNIHLKFFIQYFLPPEIEKIIYMDVDMINCRDLTELWHTDLGDKIIGAVVDPRIRTFDCYWGGVVNYQALGFSGNTKYFNTGIMLIDILKWKNNKISEKALQIIKENIASAIYPDQYGLNIVLANQWKELNPLWNFFAATINNSSPYHIHFIDRKPIYNAYKNNPIFKQQFNLFMNQTAWCNFKPIGEMRRYVKKLNNVFEKIKGRFRK